MIALLLAAAWGLLVVALAAPGPRPPRRVALLVAPAAGRGVPRASRVPDRLAASAATLLARPGGALRRMLRRPRDPAADRRLGAALAAGVLAGLLAGPAVGGGAAGAVLVWPILASRRAARRRRAALVEVLPDTVDLLVLAVGAGLTVSLAVRAVAIRAPGGLGVELRRVAHEVDLGRRLADALDELPARLGEEVRPLTAALVASERYGVPLAAGLERLAGEVRRDRRRRAEESIRKVPVKLLFPLVCCTLPAFALLTVAPLLAGSLRSLRL
ncbi:MAG: type II secretion system F family protein [Acidimicrobiales bacterium]|nr:type II secretion system F family protein [Acidimicrobiales bacterium]